jgi:hypothetical protein
VALAAVGAVMLLARPEDALAYIDPATGSAVLQGIVGGFLAALFLLKRYWRQLRARFTRSQAGGAAP